jgi:hypothetical protein
LSGQNKFADFDYLKYKELERWKPAFSWFVTLIIVLYTVNNDYRHHWTVYSVAAVPFCGTVAKRSARCFQMRAKLCYCVIYSSFINAPEKFSG